MTLHRRIRYYISRSVAVVSLVLVGIGCGQPGHSTTFEMHDAWVRTAPDTGATTAAYLTFVNGTDSPVTVSQFSSDIARAVELHESMTDAHMMMHMTPKTSLTIAPGGETVLKPGGLHLMVIGTTHPLVVGDHIRLVMHLSTGAIVSTTAHVRAP